MSPGPMAAGMGDDPALPSSIGRLRPLNAPTPVRVQAGPDGAPAKVMLRGRACPVDTVQEQWRIDEGWWWENPVKRHYWRLVLADGRLVTVYRDLTDGTWWAQRA